MTALREHEIERRLEQSKRLLQGAVDRTTTARIAKMIEELEQEKLLDKKKSKPPQGVSFRFLRKPT
jgi:hypothetical protein